MTETKDESFMSKLLTPHTIINLVTILVGLGVIYGVNMAQLDSMKQQMEKTLEVIANDRQFHVEQRVRIWNRVDKIEDAQSEINARLAAIEAMTKQTNSMVERLLSIQLQKKQ